MEGPTPVSALIHAATMVVAGVYLVARLFPLYMLEDAALMFIRGDDESFLTCRYGRGEGVEEADE